MGVASTSRSLRARGIPRAQQPATLNERTLDDAATQFKTRGGIRALPHLQLITSPLLSVSLSRLLPIKLRLKAQHLPRLLDAQHRLVWLLRLCLVWHTRVHLSAQVSAGRAHDRVVVGDEEGFVALCGRVGERKVMSAMYGEKLMVEALDSP